MKKNNVYDKGDSILEIAGQNGLHDAVLKRIKDASQCCPELQSNDPLKFALQDLLEKDLSEGEPDFHLRPHVLEEMARLKDTQILDYLRYRYSYDIYPKKKIIRDYPPLVQIEPASICNFRCVFCYQTDKRLSDKKNGHMGLMSIELFKKVIDQLEGNVQAITMASRGEPTLNNQLPEMLRYMSGKFLATKMNTNASRLTERMSNYLLDSDIHTLVFSADAADEPLYSSLRVNGKLDVVLRNIEQFNEIKEKFYPRSQMITRVSGVRFDEKQNMCDMEKFWGHLVDQVMFVDYNPWENVYDAEKKGISTPCSDLWRRMFVWWDGRVAPCDVDYLTKLSEETIESKSVSEIWQGGMYSLLREKHLSNKRQNIEPCSRCIVV